MWEKEVSFPLSHTQKYHEFILVPGSEIKLEELKNDEYVLLVGSTLKQIHFFVHECLSHSVKQITTS